MWWTLFYTLFAIMIAKCLSFVIEINGHPSNKTTFCVGDNVTLFCSGGVGAYTWTVPSLSVILSVTIGAPVETDFMMRFTAERLSTDRSSLMFTALPELIHSNITCSDGGNGMILSTAIVNVFGLPSAPDVTITHPLTNPTFLNLSIFQTGASAVCVKEYIVTINSSVNTKIVPNNPITIESEILANLKLCGINPSVSVVAIDRSGRESQPSEATIVYIATSGVVLVTTITKEAITTPRIEYKSESQGQYYFGVLIGVIVAALVIFIILVLVIILLAVKVKSLKSKIVVTNTETEETEYDEVTNSKLNKQKFKKDTYSLTKGDADIAMVGCEAYGKVSVQSQVQSAGQHGEGFAGVYEAV